MDGFQRLAMNARTGAVVRCSEVDAELLHAACEAGQYICPSPSCPAPELATVVGHDRVHGWIVRHLRHTSLVNLTDGAHTSDSTSHLLARRQLIAWLSDLGHRAHEERRGHGRTDPAVIALIQGTVFSIEVQYAPISVQLWEQRSKAAEAAGMTPWWLWGTNHPTRTDTSVSEAQRASARRYGQLWHIAANLSIPAVAGEGLDLSRRLGERSVRRPDERSSSVRVHWSPPQALMISGRGALDPHAEQSLAAASITRRSTDTRPRSLLVSA